MLHGAYLRYDIHTFVFAVNYMVSTVVGANYREVMATQCMLCCYDYVAEIILNEH